jgi:hypothetical protein
LLSILLLTSCKHDDPGKDQTGAEKNTALLDGNGSRSWVVQSVTVDGVDKTSTFSGLTITFTSTGYTATHGGSIWPASGTWSFTNDDGTTFTRDDGTSVDVSVTPTQLQLTLNWTKALLGPGRISGVAGKYVFVMGI